MSMDTAYPAHQSKLYYEFSNLYDLVFARIFYPRIASVIRSLVIPSGSKVLELGVGTGLALGAYPRHAQVIGVDLAPDMLEHAQERIEENDWHHVRVMEMDAMALDFPAASFDYVMAFHVVSVVPNALQFMAEACRVCRPGGTVVVINHFRSERPLLAAIDRRLEPITRRCGWHTLERTDVFNGLPLKVDRVYKTSRHSLFTIVVAQKAETQSVPHAGPWIDRHDAAPN